MSEFIQPAPSACRSSALPSPCSMMVLKVAWNSMGEGVNIAASTGTRTSKLSIRLLIVFSAQCQVVILLFNFKCSPYFTCWGK